MRTRKNTGSLGPAGTKPYRPFANNGHVAARIRQLIEPVCCQAGLELLHVEFQSEAGGKALRAYIDRPDGVTLADCELISREVGDLLDVHLEEKVAYRLEVSSPGSERPLGRVADFDSYKGHGVIVKTAQPVDGKKKFKGILQGTRQETVIVQTVEKTVAIPLEAITSARLASGPTS